MGPETKSGGGSTGSGWGIIRGDGGRGKLSQCWVDFEGGNRM